jgi:serine O-acetyltransferase
VARLGHHVWVGVGAKIVGNVVIGDRVVIGANAVVTHDIPADSLAVGIPAVARPRKAAPVSDPHA